MTKEESDKGKGGDGGGGKGVGVGGSAMKALHGGGAYISREAFGNNP